jgi:hypothetical protein
MNMIGTNKDCVVAKMNVALHIQVSFSGTFMSIRSARAKDAVTTHTDLKLMMLVFS